MVNSDNSSANNIDKYGGNFFETPWEKYPFCKTVDYVLICFEIFPSDRRLKISSLQLNQLENRIILFQYPFRSAKTLMGRRNSIYDQFVPVMARHFIWNRQKFPDIFLQVIENEELAVFSNNFQTWSYKEKN